MSGQFSDKITEQFYNTPCAALQFRLALHKCCFCVENDTHCCLSNSKMVHIRLIEDYCRLPSGGRSFPMASNALSGQQSLLRANNTLLISTANISGRGLFFRFYIPFAEVSTYFSIFYF